MIEINCRTCKQSRPIDEAQWVCDHKRQVLSEEHQRKGCQDHLLIPGLLWWAKAIDQEPGAVIYQTSKGSNFRNTTEAERGELAMDYTSGELTELKGPAFIDAPAAENLRAKFALRIGEGDDGGDIPF